jgi:hypothetical protein
MNKLLVNPNMQEEVEDQQNRTLQKSGTEIRLSVEEPHQPLITGAGGQADQLAEMIEQENQRLRSKQAEMKEQLRQKQAYVALERQRYLQKISRLQAMRDEVMQRFMQKSK